jgi:hypothetical protein
LEVSVVVTDNDFVDSNGEEGGFNSDTALKTAFVIASSVVFDIPAWDILVLPDVVDAALFFFASISFTLLQPSPLSSSLDSISITHSSSLALPRWLLLCGVPAPGSG